MKNFFVDVLKMWNTYDKMKLIQSLQITFRNKTEFKIQKSDSKLHTLDIWSEKAHAVQFILKKKQHQGIYLLTYLG